MTVPPPTSPRPVNNQAGRILQTVLSAAVLLATVFTAFSPKMFSGDFGTWVAGLLNQQADGVLAVPTQQGTIRIGIVSGHWGNGDDPGAVCADGVTNEQEVNLAIASLVRQKLEARGLEIDLLQEFDPRLEGYEAALLLSIHSDTCDVIDDQATGFKVAASTYSMDSNLAARLTACLYDRYASTTSMRYHPGSITLNMTDYHAFSVIKSNTTAAIIEVGFLNLDRAMLVDHPDMVADALVAGVLCFINNESAQSAPLLTP